MAELTYRAADERDIDAVVDLVDSAYRGDASRQGWTTEADLLEGQRTDAQAVAAMVDGDGSMILLAHDDGSLVACCQLEGRPDAVAYFGLFAVRPGRQGGGLGRMVIAEAERVARNEWGTGRMEMTVIGQRSELVAWYRRLGYEPTGETRPFPYGDERYGIPTRDDLEFVVLAKAILGP